jgi:membrane protein implicated in regulation of membrane protease activity
MFVLGLILILLAAGLLLGAMVWGADDRATFDVGSLNTSMSTMVVFLLGALTLLLLILGLSLLRSAGRRAANRRKEHKELSRREKKLEKREAELRRSEADGDTRTETRADSHGEPRGDGERL